MERTARGLRGNRAVRLCPLPLGCSGGSSGHVAASVPRYLAEAGTAADGFVVAAGLVSEASDAPKHAVKSRRHNRCRRRTSTVRLIRRGGQAVRRDCRKDEHSQALTDVQNTPELFPARGHNRSMGQATDGDLWRRAVDGEPDAFGVLFERHAQGVYNYLFRRTASGRSQKT